MWSGLEVGERVGPGIDLRLCLWVGEGGDRDG